MLLKREMGFYEKYVKRILDIICSFCFIVLFCWLYTFIAIVVKIKMGSPVIFKQVRPGIIKDGEETLFYMYKFRTMTNETDSNGELLQDDKRLSVFGKVLRSTSLDELPEVFCILKGDMSVVGPRPQLVRDMVFMTEQQRMRHTAKPGLTGLAQVKGRNAITWEEKLNWDLKYIENVNIFSDIHILFDTVIAVLNRTGITDGENVTALDYGDTLLRSGAITPSEFEKMQAKAKKIIIEGTEKGLI